jgi:hypothetical protein
MFLDFSKGLTRRCEAEKITLAQWSGVQRANEKLVEMQKDGVSVLVYIRESNLARGFWGLNPNRLRSLTASPHRWFLLLLGATDQSACLASPRDVDDRLGYEWRQAGNSDYKVHEGAELLGIARLSYVEAIEYLIFVLTDTEERVRENQYITIGTQDIADFLLRIPGKTRRVARISTKNVRSIDLLAAFAAFGLAPGHSVSETIAKGLPIFARLFEILKDDDAVVIRCLCEIGGGANPVGEERLFSRANAELISREEPAMKADRFRAILEKLDAKGCIEQFPGTSRKWRLRELVV